MNFPPLSTLILLIGLVGLSAKMSSLAQAPLVVKFAPEKDYGPFVYADTDGSVKGLSIDMLGLVAKASDLQISSLPPQSLGEILNMAREGKVDVISSLRPTLERSEFLAFTKPYVSVPAVLVARSGGLPRLSLNELVGKSVGVGKGYAAGSYAMEKYPKVLWQELDDDVAALQELLAGKLDALVIDTASLAFAARMHGYRGFHVYAPIGFEYSLSFAYRKDRPDIGAALDSGLRSITEKERQKIISRWMGFNEQTAPDNRVAVIQLIAAAFAALAGLLFARKLWGYIGRAKGNT